MQFKIYLNLLFVALIGLTFSGCVDQEFDEPPVREFANIQATHTIQDLKDLHDIAKEESTPISDSTTVVISGTVIGDDRSGNIFKQLYIEDETGGIIIRLDRNGLYTQYPVGTQIFVLMNGLYVGDFANLYQIVADSEGERIPDVVIESYVSIGGVKEVNANPVSLADLNNNANLRDSLQSRLISLEGVQFVEIGSTYANPTALSSTNLTLKDCEGNTITVRNSDFSDFAALPLPVGNGSLTAIFGVFGDTPQLTLRGTEDVNLNGTLCGGSTGSNLVTIQSLREAFANGETSGPEDSKIRGIVISDRASNNINNLNMVVQDETGGIIVRFGQSPPFALGEEVEIVVSGQEVSEFNGGLQLNNVALGNVTSISTGNTVTPRVATVSELLSNAEAWESTLVQIENATMNGGPTYGDDVTVSDGTGSINMFTFFTSNFGDNDIPSGTGTLTAILSEFNNVQLNMRNIGDADFEGSTGGGDPQPITASELRALYEGGASSVPANRIFRAIVISDGSNGNLTARNTVMQDATGGIVVRYTDDAVFGLGEDVEVNVSGMELSEFNGLLQVNNVPNANAISYGPGTLPTPREATIAEILTNSEAWESTLVEIQDVSFTTGGTYSGGKVLNDGSGTIDMFTRSQASFANDNVPTDAFTMIAIVSQFTDPQVIIRNLNDIIE